VAATPRMACAWRIRDCWHARPGRIRRTIWAAYSLALPPCDTDHFIVRRQGHLHCGAPRHATGGGDRGS